MRDISAVAEQLQAVRRAKEKFLNLWTLEQTIIFPALDRVAADLEGTATAAVPTRRPPNRLNDSGPPVDN